MDLPPLGGTLKDAFEIKVYEIDDVERLQRRKEGMITEVRALLCFIKFACVMNAWQAIDPLKAAKSLKAWCCVQSLKCLSSLNPLI